MPQAMSQRTLSAERATPGPCAGAPVQLAGPLVGHVAPPSKNFCKVGNCGDAAMLFSSSRTLSLFGSCSPSPSPSCSRHLGQAQHSHRRASNHSSCRTNVASCSCYAHSHPRLIAATLAKRGSHQCFQSFQLCSLPPHQSVIQAMLTPTLAFLLWPPWPRTAATCMPRGGSRHPLRSAAPGDLFFEMQCHWDALARQPADQSRREMNAHTATAATAAAAMPPPPPPPPPPSPSYCHPGQAEHSHTPVFPVM